MSERMQRVSAGAVSSVLSAGLFAAALWPCSMDAQAPDPGAVSSHEPTSIALPLPEDRGQNALEQSLRRLRTTASVMMIVAHPDDEDGSLLTYLSRNLGARVTLFTLTRGEGGQNAMSADVYDALGVMRTNELLRADQYYGAKQLWGTEADFGFSKTQEEAFARWRHDRVLYDAVLAVRRERPLVIVATFVGAVSDGHGQHQVSGEIAQEVFKAAGDPKVFPEQLKDGIEPWQPLAVYSMVPFAPITDKGMFDYATGKWAPAQFKNYITGEVIHGALSADATMPVGNRDALLGRSYVQIAREGWGEQKSQNGGANPSLSGPANTSYHLWAVAPEARATGAAKGGDLFHNSKINIDTSFSSLARLAGNSSEIRNKLADIDHDLASIAKCPCEPGASLGHQLASAYRKTLELHESIAKSSMDTRSKDNLLFELDWEIAEFQEALRQALGLDVIAFTTNSGAAQGGPRGSSADETPQSVSPGQEFRVRIHASQAASESRLSKVWLESQSGDAWKTEMLGSAPDPASSASNAQFKVTASADAAPTQPFFTRPTIEQPYYDIANPAWRVRSFMPWPLSAWAEFIFDGLPIRIGEAVQTLQRTTGPGGSYQPLIVTPAIGVSVTPENRILPLSGLALPVSVTVHTQAAAEGTVSLKLPEGWHSEPATASFKRTAAGDTDPIIFKVTPRAVHTGAYAIQATASSRGKTYTSGWRSVGYQGLHPYNIYRPAELKTRKVDVKIAPGLRIGYVMGPGDQVPEAIEAMGITPHLITANELTSCNFSDWNVIVIGIRAYSTRSELAKVQPRLDEFVRNGGTLIVQYQSATFPAPFPITLGRIPERVVDENAPVKLLAPDNSVLSFPNHITSADFDGWVEERGHSFAESWDKSYTPLTETADPGQDPQRGGLLVAHAGKGTYIYASYALYRQLPELVPGAYRILANLLSAGSVSNSIR